MKKLAKTVLAPILLALVASCLWAAPMKETKETAVIRLAAYIPEKTSSTRYDKGFFVESNAYNFSYSMQQIASTKVFFVIAD